MGWTSFRHLCPFRKQASSKFSRDSLHSGFDTLGHSLLHLLIQGTALLLLLFLLLVHPLDFLLGRHNLLAFQADSRRNSTKNISAAWDTNDMLINRIIGSL